MMTIQERQQVLVEFNRTHTQFPAHSALHRLVEAQVSRSPDATAVVCEGETLSYRELNRRANQLAHHLRSLGVGTDVLVGIRANRSLELITGLLGILKAGGAYLPIDADDPTSRSAFMLQDSAAPVLLTTESLGGTLAVDGTQIVYLDRDWDEIARQPAADPDAGVRLDNLAYVIYTSGSTGKPKGAMNTHAGICNRLLWMQNEYCLTAHDAVLQKTPFTFDVSVWEFFWPLIAGSRIVLARPGGHLDSTYLKNLIQQEGVTVLHFVPSMLHLFLQERGLAQCTAIRDVMCSGEALSVELQERFFARIDANLHNLYGPTEAAIDVTFWRCRPGDSHRSVPIGRPVANTQIYILDDDLEPVPIGATGELHIGGVQVARGYLNRPELTAERFIADPFQNTPNARLYKTGDQARFLPDGNIEFLGRLDDQVKVRGFRIELAEIEAALSEHPSVARAAVLAREDHPREKRLVAYVMQARDLHANVSELRHFLEERLPEYMVPAAFVELESFPLTANGKLDRRALPAPGGARPELNTPYAEPRSALEKHLVGMWREILQLDRIGIDDRFFELGGSSLQAARFINAIQERLAENVYIVTIFEAPSIREYAQLLRRQYRRSLAKLVPEHSARASAQRKGVVPSVTNGVAAVRSRSESRVTTEDLSRMREFIPTRSSLRRPREAKNPTAIFVLSPPRSGTTLLRVMLAGHPQLFSAAELQLLSFETLQERRAAFTGKYSLWLEGTIRAIMEIKQCKASEAKKIMQDYEKRDLSTQSFYRVLQEWIGDRTLVDKTPAYASDPHALRSAEGTFENPLYIHLVRHPYAMARSFENYHMDQVVFLREHPFTARQLGEMLWTISHQNTLAFLEGVPQERQARMRFEDLVRNPEPVLRGMCSKLGLKFHPEMAQPYKDTERKMTDGIYRESTPMGDTKFLEHKRIDPEVAESWRRVVEDDFLGETTWELAHKLGYERPSSHPIAAIAPRLPADARRALAERQRLLRQTHRRARHTDG